MRRISLAKRFSVRLLAGIVVALSTVMSYTIINAQNAATSAIEGIVTDPNGALVQGAKVMVRNTDNGLTRETITDTGGIYRLTALPPGTYQLTAKAQGFSENKYGTLVLNVGQKVNLDLKLQVNVSETIEISATTQLLETSRTQVSETVNERSIRELPVNGRNYLDFIVTTPGVVRDPRAGDLSFAGQKGTLNSVQVDGVDSNNVFFGQAAGRTGTGRAPFQISQDAVQEYQVNTNGYAAEFGRSGGGSTNVITKSGTNEWHGTGFEFYRDRSLNANSLNYNSSLEKDKGAPGFLPNGFGYDPLTDSVIGKGTKPSYHYNQFGGVIGGPILRDKIFILGNYEGQRSTQPNIIAFGAAPDTTAASIAGRAKLQPKAVNYTRNFNLDAYFARMDFQLDESNRLSLRFNTQYFKGTNLENAGSTSTLEHTGNSDVRTYNIVLSLNSALSPRLINEFRAQIARDKEPGSSNSDAPEGVIAQGGNTALMIGRNNFSPRETTEKKFQLIDTVTYSMGPHNFRGGADLNFEDLKNYFPGMFGGRYFFNSYANYFNNVVNQYSQSFAGPGTSGPTTYPDFNEFGFFLQDDWKVKSNLTMYLGVRYDLQMMTKPTVKNPAASLAAAGIDTSVLNNDTTNVAPRLGFAYSPKSNLVVRGGYGMFYSRTPAIMLSTALAQNGINVVSLDKTFSATSPAPASLVYPFRYATLSDAITGLGGAATPSIYFFDSNYQQPYTQQASLGAEYGITPDVAVSVSYLMVKGSHLQRTRDINLLAPVLTPVAGGYPSILRNPGTGTVTSGSPTRPITGFNRVSKFEGTGNSFYNGLVISVEKRFSRNFQATASYTFSKIIDDKPDATSVVPFNSNDDSKQVQQSFLIRDDRGPGDSFTPHRFVGRGVWSLSYFKGSNRYMNALLNGWEVGGIYQVSSNTPFSARMGTTDLNRDGNQYTDRAPGFGRNQYRRDTLNNLDINVSRFINVTEKCKFQIRGELFNAFNRVNYLTFTSTYASATELPAGVITVSPQAFNFAFPRSTYAYGSTGSARVGQLVAKFIF